MRKLQLFFILLIGGLAVYFEFQNIKESTVLGIDPDSLSLIILGVLTFTYLYKTLMSSGETKNHKRLIPFAISLVLLIIIFGHKVVRTYLDSSTTLFTAYNQKIGNDGGLTFDFKTNNHLKGLRVDKFSETYYWGSYTKQNDTLKLSINLDFKMGRLAIIQNDSLRFIDDSTKFDISFP